jgi:hypothetical protein
MDKDAVLILGRVVQEFCNILPDESVVTFAQGLRANHGGLSPWATSILNAYADDVLGLPLPEQPQRRPALRVIEGGASGIGWPRCNLSGKALLGNSAA